MPDESHRTTEAWQIVKFYKVGSLGITLAMADEACGPLNSTFDMDPKEQFYPLVEMILNHRSN
jgi:uncharacterized lipoprotein NlpE involved in copper resistance